MESWQVQEDRSPMDGSRTVTLELESDSTVEGWLANTKPTLVIRCLEHQTVVYVVTGLSAQPELGEYDRYSVQIRLDDRKAMTQHWSQSTDSKALFAPSAVGLARRLGAAKTMLFRFTPFNSSPALAKFDLGGLDRYLPKVSAACGW
jgi:type VI secretion system protein VasI